MTDVLRVGGRERTFTIRVPVATPAQQMPLVLVLHGNNPGGDGARMMRELTTFDRQTQARGFAIVYPDGVDGSWADGRGVTAADEAGVDDVAFLTALIEWSAEHHGTSPDRNIVAGLSNGAFMAHRLALTASDRVAVLAAVAGGLPAGLADVGPTHAVSALLIHGTADEISPIEGGHSRRRGPNGELRGRTLSLAESADRWRTIDRCAPDPGTTRSTELSSRTDSAAGVGGCRVAAWTVFGGGHSWPGAPTGEWEPTSQEFDAAEEICRFAEPLLIGAAARQL
ncbi:alpha/beta hydrolase family esterase [Kribbella sp. NPDC051586]|uniref:alpha/beta hydrolase family esterase n=1 Tax=Kribbella sp. NPDC051586 TaxID=3364118 RepID=UPI0037B2B5C3